MLLNFMKAKIHKATVTQTDLFYEGSITIDQSIMREAGILPYEQLQVYNTSSAARFTTYAIEGLPGKGDFCVNGAAARLNAPGDSIIIVSYCLLTQEEAQNFQPRVLLMNSDNTIKDSFTVRGNQPKKVGASLLDRK